LLKRKQVKIPVHGLERELLFSFLVAISGGEKVSLLSGYVKGDLNKHYDGNRNPIQSFLFCIKATNYEFNIGNSIFFVILKILWSFIC